MKLQLACAALAALALQGCATYGDNALIASPSADNQYYCWESRVVDVEGKYFCNWTADARKACESNSWEYLEAQAVVEAPKRLRRCENGSRLVVVRVRPEATAKK
jgi:hypothetical protein